jgi:hypothetical protein
MHANGLPTFPSSDINITLSRNKGRPLREYNILKIKKHFPVNKLLLERFRNIKGHEPGKRTKRISPCTKIFGSSCLLKTSTETLPPPPPP